MYPQTQRLIEMKRRLDHYTRLRCQGICDPSIAKKYKQQKNEFNKLLIEIKKQKERK